MNNLHRSEDETYSNNHRYPQRSDPDVVLIPPLRTDSRVHNNLVSASRTSTLTVMMMDQRPPDAPHDPATLTTITDTLHNILAQLTTINKRLELQGESIAWHDQLLKGQTRTVASTPLRIEGEYQFKLRSNPKVNHGFPPTLIKSRSKSSNLGQT
jgi:hypothetical protein